MKKLFYSLLAVGFALSTEAQVSLKPAIGGNFTSVSEDPASGNTEGRFGWQVGATVLSGDKFYGEAGLFYATTSTDVSDTLTSFENKMTGIRIPVMGGYHLVGSQGSTVNVRVFGGGQLFVLTDVESADFTKDDFSSPTGGLLAGVGANFGFVFVDASYMWSLSDVASSTGPQLDRTGVSSSTQVLTSSYLPGKELIEYILVLRQSPSPAVEGLFHFLSGC